MRAGARRSYPLLFFGLTCTAFLIFPLPALDRLFSKTSPILSPFFLLFDRVPKNHIASGALPEKFPDSEFLVEKESQFFLPLDPELAARKAVFANVIGANVSGDELTLDVGFSQGVVAGMAGVVRDDFLGVVVQVEPDRCLLRLPNHPNARTGARSGDVRFVACGTKTGRVQVQLNSARNLDSGAKALVAPAGLEAQEAASKSEDDTALNWVRGLDCAQGAMLGTLAEFEIGNHSSFRILPALDAKKVQAVWLLSAGAVSSAARLQAFRGERHPVAAIHWTELSPWNEGFLFEVSEGAAELPVAGDALLTRGILLGRVEKMAGRIGWARKVNDSLFRARRYLLNDRGELSLLEGAEALNQEGWVFTAQSANRLPKGILIGRSRLEDGKYRLQLPALAFDGPYEWVALP